MAKKRIAWMVLDSIPSEQKISLEGTNEKALGRKDVIQITNSYNKVIFKLRSTFIICVGIMNYHRTKYY